MSQLQPSSARRKRLYFYPSGTATSSKNSGTPPTRSPAAPARKPSPSRQYQIETRSKGSTPTKTAKRVSLDSPKQRTLLPTSPKHAEEPFGTVLRAPRAESQQSRPAVVVSRAPARPTRRDQDNPKGDPPNMSKYNNAALTLVPHATGDPFVAHALNKFYLTFTLGDRIELWRADTLDGFMTTGEKICVFRAPPDTDHSQGLWAPELHDIGGRWFILYTAEDPKIGIDSHRMFVLGGPPSNVDPCVPHDAPKDTWQDLGHIGGMRADQWAIDGTYFWADGGLYMAYSGSPIGIHPAQAKVQQLFVVHMSSPTNADSPPSLISEPTEPYEYEGDRGVNEGPQWLAAPDGSWRGLVMSVSGTWNQNYKMLPLTYLGGNPLDARSWRKWRTPLLQKGKGMRGPFGPGHGNFVQIGQETIAIFHATDGPRDGFENRKARAQRVAWTRDGPYMGGYVGPVMPDMNAFNGGPSDQQIKAARRRSAGQRWSDFKMGYKYWTSGW